MTRFKRSELISKIFYQKNQKRQKKMKDIHILLKINSKFYFISSNEYKLSDDKKSISAPSTL